MTRSKQFLRGSKVQLIATLCLNFIILVTCPLNKRDNVRGGVFSSILKKSFLDTYLPIINQKNALLFKLILIFNSHSTNYYKVVPKIWKWDNKKGSYLKVFEKNLSHFWLTVQCKVRAEGKAPGFSAQLLLSY